MKFYKKDIKNFIERFNREEKSSLILIRESALVFNESLLECNKIYLICDDYKVFNNISKKYNENIINNIINMGGFCSIKYDYNYKNKNNIIINEGIFIEDESSIINKLENNDFFLSEYYNYLILLESKLSVEERNKLKTSDYGIPSKRKFPIHDRKHVKAAISLFKYCEEEDRKELAKNIFNKAKNFGISITNSSTLFSYLSDEDKKYLVKNNGNKNNDKNTNLKENKEVITVINEGQNRLSIFNPNIENAPAILETCDKIYLGSDWHMLQEKKTNYNYSEEYIDKYNEVITENDAFIYLGDLIDDTITTEVMSKVKTLCSKMNKAKVKIFILGNNDCFPKGFPISCGFDYVFEGIFFKDYIFTHAPLNKDIFDKYSAYNTNYINIHGHLHSDNTYYDTAKHPKFYIKVYSEENKGYPIDFQEIIFNKAIDNERLFTSEDFSTFILNTYGKNLLEAINFPSIKIDKEGNIIIRKRDRESLMDIFSNTVKLAKVYRKAKNLEALKHLLCKAFYVFIILSKQYNQLDKREITERKKIEDNRAVVMSFFKENLEFILKHEEDFNFDVYFQKSMYNEEAIKIDKELIGKLLRIILVGKLAT